MGLEKYRMKFDLFSYSFMNLHIQTCFPSLLYSPNLSIFIRHFRRAKISSSNQFSGILLQFLETMILGCCKKLSNVPALWWPCSKPKTGYQQAESRCSDVHPAAIVPRQSSHSLGTRAECFFMLSVVIVLPIFFL